jgi:hypothetical protein
MKRTSAAILRQDEPQIHPEPVPTNRRKYMTATVGSSESRPQQPKRAEGRESTNLDRRYGRIGISSVAAAARYASGGRKPAETPAPTRIDPRFVEQSS